MLVLQRPLAALFLVAIACQRDVSSFSTTTNQCRSNNKISFLEDSFDNGRGRITSLFSHQQQQEQAVKKNYSPFGSKYQTVNDNNNSYMASLASSLSSAPLPSYAPPPPATAETKAAEAVPATIITTAERETVSAASEPYSALPAPQQQEQQQQQTPKKSYSPFGQKPKATSSSASSSPFSLYEPAASAATVTTDTPKPVEEVTVSTEQETPVVASAAPAASATSSAAAYSTLPAPLEQQMKKSYSPFGQKPKASSLSSSPFSLYQPSAAAASTTESKTEEPVSATTTTAFSTLSAPPQQEQQPQQEMKKCYSPFGKKPIATSSASSLYEPPVTATTIATETTKTEVVAAASAPTQVTPAASASATAALYSTLPAAPQQQEQQQPMKKSYSPFGQKPVAPVVSAGGAGSMYLSSLPQLSLLPVSSSSESVMASYVLLQQQETQQQKKTVETVPSVVAAEMVETKLKTNFSPFGKKTMAPVVASGAASSYLSSLPQSSPTSSSTSEVPPVPAAAIVDTAATAETPAGVMETEKKTNFSPFGKKPVAPVVASASAAGSPYLSSLPPPALSESSTSSTVPASTGAAGTTAKTSYSPFGKKYTENGTITTASTATGMGGYLGSLSGPESRPFSWTDFDIQEPTFSSSSNIRSSSSSSSSSSSLPIKPEIQTTAPTSPAPARAAKTLSSSWSNNNMDSLPTFLQNTVSVEQDFSFRIPIIENIIVPETFPVVEQPPRVESSAVSTAAAPPKNNYTPFGRKPAGSAGTVQNNAMLGGYLNTLQQSPLPQQVTAATSSVVTAAGTPSTETVVAESVVVEKSQDEQGTSKPASSSTKYYMPYGKRFRRDFSMRIPLSESSQISSDSRTPSSSSSFDTTPSTTITTASSQIEDFSLLIPISDDIKMPPPDVFTKRSVEATEEPLTRTTMGAPKKNFSPFGRKPAFVPTGRNKVPLGGNDYISSMVGDVVEKSDNQDDDDASIIQVDVDDVPALETTVSSEDLSDSEMGSGDLRTASGVSYLSSIGQESKIQKSYNPFGPAKKFKETAGNMGYLGGLKAPVTSADPEMTVTEDSDKSESVVTDSLLVSEKVSTSTKASTSYLESIANEKKTMKKNYSPFGGKKPAAVTTMNTGYLGSLSKSESTVSTSYTVSSWQAREFAIWDTLLGSSEVESVVEEDDISVSCALAGESHVVAKEESSDDLNVTAVSSPDPKPTTNLSSVQVTSVTQTKSDTAKESTSYQTSLLAKDVKLKISSAPTSVNGASKTLTMGQNATMEGLMTSDHAITKTLVSVAVMNGVAEEKDTDTAEFIPRPPDYPPPPMLGNYNLTDSTHVEDAKHNTKKPSVPKFFFATETVESDEEEEDEKKVDVVPASSKSSADEWASPIKDVASELQVLVDKSKKEGDSSILNLDRILEDIKAALPKPPEVDVEDSLPSLDTRGMTERIMKKTSAKNQASGAGGASTWDAFLKAEENWAKLKSYKRSPDERPPQFVTLDDGGVCNPKCWEKLRKQEGKKLDYDVVVCGGTLGIFFAAALQQKGHKVCVLEAGKLRGREQEWNISMKELLELVELGILTQEDVGAAIKTQFPGCRSGFKNVEVTPLKGGYSENGIGYECFTEDVLNLGVAPSVLLDRVKRRFEEMGGVVKEETRLNGIAVSELFGTALDLGDDVEPATTRLVLDCMGNGSPISRQQRFGMKPDGICAVVGSLASGFDNSTNTVGDIIYTNTMIQDKGKNGQMQYFWEAFPVGIGRDGKEPGSSDKKTTYMFTYMDAKENRPSLETLMEDYWKLLPKYQPSIKNPETDLDVERVLFAYFPTYRDSPLKPDWGRILAVGDASGIQSPLSFGGFGALTRHLARISGAVTEALENDCLDKESLGEINAYTPNLSAAWMFQKAMSVRMGQNVDPKFMNRLLATNFEVMDEMGQRTIKPFLQDVIRFDGLVASLVRSFAADPTFMPEIVQHVGVLTLIDWVFHVSMMGTYGFLDAVVAPFMKVVFLRFIDDPKDQFIWKRRMEAWKFGSGNDYILPAK